MHLAQDEGDILVFMPGQEDIEVTCETVSCALSVNDNFSSDWAGGRSQHFQRSGSYQAMVVNLWFGELNDAK